MSSQGLPTGQNLVGVAEEMWVEDGPSEWPQGCFLPMLLLGTACCRFSFPFHPACLCSPFERLRAALAPWLVTWAVSGTGP